MAATSHQTVRIARGRHKSPDDGACVMELSSMLSGEAFSDRPRCVDRVLAAYMRALNDRLGTKARQRLFPYAAQAVGTAGDGRCEQRRALCFEFAGLPATRWATLRARLRLAFAVGILLALTVDEPAAELAARRVAATRDVDAALALLERLLGSEAAAFPGAVAGLPEVRVPSRVG